MKVRRVDPLCTLVESYLRNHLPCVQGASPHTIRAYTHALRLFFLFLSKRARRPIDAITLDDIDTDAVLAFLDHAQSSRGNSASTRNCRLSAIRGLVAHMLRHDLTRATQYQRIMTIRPKRARTSPVEYLESELVRAIIDQPNTRFATGQRDRALLLLLFNTGVRVSEALGITPADLRFMPAATVRVHGKGKKERLCPLWSETARSLRSLARHVPSPDDALFRNTRGAPLSRDGVAYILRRAVQSAASAGHPDLRRRRVTPHVIRHSCAVALLQAGVDLTVIRDYLGHASIATTGRYVVADLASRREALESFWSRAGLGSRGSPRWRPTPRILEILSSA